MARKGFNPSEDSKNRIRQAIVLLDRAAFEKETLLQILEAVKKGAVFLVHIGESKKYFLMPRAIAENLGLLSLPRKKLSVSSLEERPLNAFSAMETNAGLVYEIPGLLNDPVQEAVIFVRAMPVKASFNKEEYSFPKSREIRKYARLKFLDAKKYGREHNAKMLVQFSDPQIEPPQPDSPKPPGAS